MITLISGCGTSDELSARKKAEEMFSSPYRAECKAKIISNKTENEYTYTCESSPSGDTVLDYGDLKITLSENGAVIENGEDSIYASVTEAELWLSPQSYFNAYLKGGDFAETEDGYLCESEIDDNIYRKKIKIELDKKCVPVKMTVSDEKGEEKTEIDVKSFTHKKGSS